MLGNAGKLAVTSYVTEISGPRHSGQPLVSAITLFIPNFIDSPAVLPFNLCWRRGNKQRTWEVSQRKPGLVNRFFG